MLPPYYFYWFRIDNKHYYDLVTQYIFGFSLYTQVRENQIYPRLHSRTYLEQLEDPVKHSRHSRSSQKIRSNIAEHIWSSYKIQSNIADTLGAARRSSQTQQNISGAARRSSQTQQTLQEQLEDPVKYSRTYLEQLEDPVKHSRHSKYVYLLIKYTNMYIY